MKTTLTVVQAVRCVTGSHSIRPLRRGHRVAIGASARARRRDPGSRIFWRNLLHHLVTTYHGT